MTQEGSSSSEKSPKDSKIEIEKLPEGYWRDRDSDTDFSDVQDYVDEAKRKAS